MRNLEITLSLEASICCWDDGGENIWAEGANIYIFAFITTISKILPLQTSINAINLLGENILCHKMLLNA